MNPKVLFVNILVILVIVAGLGAGVYYYNQTANYVSTNNARVDGERVASILPPGQTTKVDVDFPVAGTIVQQSAVPNTFVAPGFVLARAYDLNSLWITANIDERNYNDIKVGQTVDVYVDAFPGTVLSGKVDKIGQATAGSFSLLPSSNTTANYTKVSQVLPVTILLDGYRGVALAPGMSATVRIHI